MHANICVYSESSSVRLCCSNPIRQSKHERAPHTTSRIQLARELRTARCDKAFGNSLLEWAITEKRREGHASLCCCDQPAYFLAGAVTLNLKENHIAVFHDEFFALHAECRALS